MSRRRLCNLDSCFYKSFPRAARFCSESCRSSSFAGCEAVLWGCFASLLWCGCGGQAVWSAQLSYRAKFFAIGPVLVRASGHTSPKAPRDVSGRLASCLMLWRLSASAPCSRVKTACTRPLITQRCRRDRGGLLSTAVNVASKKNDAASRGSAPVRHGLSPGRTADGATTDRPRRVGNRRGARQDL